MSYQLIEVDVPALEVQRLELQVNGSAVAIATKSPGKPAQLIWLIYGPQELAAAKEVLLGLLELSVQADRMDYNDRGATHEKTKRR